MGNKNASEPAFGFVDNRSGSYEDNEVHYGLTKREYFAGLAMQGFCASGVGTDPSIKEQLKRHGFNPDDEKNIAEAIAIFSVACADELLKQLNP